MIDFLIVITYFAVVLLVALRGKISADSSAEEYFLSSRNLPWYSIALSTIATNIQGYQFLGMMGSAYLFGLAQANLEINAVQGILLGTFVFVPLFLKYPWALLVISRTQIAVFTRWARDIQNVLSA